MKQIQIILLVLFCAFTGFHAVGQANANLNILTLNSGQVNQGSVVDLQVSVGNTGPGSSIGVNKVRAQISIPIAIATALPTVQQTGLPAGWIVLTNTGGAITVCNGTDVIPVGEQRQIFIKIQGTAVGGPSTINGSLSFGPGSGVCTGPGSLSGDNTADNTSTSSITVLPAPACNLALTASAGTIACNGGTTNLTATATGGAGAVEYSLNGGAFQVSNVFAVNATGSPYTVTVRESANTSCTANASPVTVTEPAAITATASAQTINCFGGTTTLTITASGGTAPLQYSLNGGAYQAGNTFTVSATGSPYTVTVKDANLCTATTNAVTVTEPTVLTATATATPVSTIGGTDGTATAVPVGGTSPYTYSWAPGGQTTVTATGLTAGSYTVTVTDSKGCTTTASATVGSPTCNVTASAVAGSAILCNAGTTSLTVTATGAAAPVQYSINGGVTFQPGNVFTVGAGTYTVTVKDVNNCTATTSAVTITQPTAVLVGATAQPIALPGGTTTVVITASGGTAPYTGTGSFVRSAGTYTFTVTDANGCAGSTTLTLNDPVAGNANASLNILTLNSGQVNLNGFVDLQISVGNTGPSFIGVNKVRAQISIPIAIATALPNAQQTGLPAGWIILTNTGGTITICNGTDQIPSGQQRQLFIKLQGTAAGGPSTINGSLSFGPGTGVCTGPGSLPGDNTADNTSTSSITVISTCNLAVAASAGTIACNGGSTTLTATATGATGAVEYSLNGGAFQSGNTFTVNAAGSPYTVTAREVANTACTATSSAVTVAQPTVLSATASSTAVTTIGGSDGTATAVPAGGTAPYSYLWSPGGQTTVTATGLTAGSYTVTVTDFKGCTTTATTTVGSPACNISASASAGTIACFGGTTTLAVTVTGATAPVQYSLNGGAFQLGNTFTVNAAGSPYTVSVKDANLCTATTSAVTVGQPSQLVASSTAGVAACGGTVTVTVSATGGTAPYSGTGAFNAAAGPYTYTVTDANGCTSVTTGTVTTAADNTNPTITAPANVSACTNSGCTATGVNLGTPVTADNCSVASVTNNAPAAFPLGATTVTWTVTDGSGNTATATQIVTVTDGIAPSIYINQTGLLAGNTGTSSTATPYLLPVKPGVKFTSILSATNTVGGYQMAGIPDGLGAFDNCNGTFTLLMNHELGNTLGIVRSHGAIGSFVSKWVINKSTLSVVSGSDLMTSVYGWNSGTQSSNATTGTFAFNRFCSGDLPAVSAFYNAATGLGTKARIYMHGEEGGATGYQLGTVASGPDAGKAYILGKFNLTTNGSGLTGIGAWENALANPFAQNKTIVIGNNDGGTGIMANSVAVYVGTKTNTGSEVDKAGLTNGTLSFVNVTGNPVEIVNTTTRATNITSGTAFTLSSTASTTFSRPEDGVWNPANPAQYFFVTTDQLDQVADGLGAQIGRSRLWRLNFTDITNPALGGTIDMLLDGTEGHNMLDNLTADKQGHLILQEDVGNAAHNGKIWQYTIATDQLTQIAKHDPARFGDRVAGVTTAATAPFTTDEESSGIIDASDILGAGWFLTSDQAHYTTGIPSAVVEGGQLLAVFNPESVGATGTATDTVRACFGTTVSLGTPATTDNCTVASVTNNAPASFPVGNTTVTWTVTDGSGNTTTATQVVVITSCNNPLAATFVKTNLSACGGSNDGTITALATGGLAPYTYSWTGETGSNHTPFTAGNVSSLTGLNYGYYNVTITDANLNTVTLSNIHVEFAFAVFITYSGSNTSSCGNTGSISLFGNSGVQPYTYSLDGITYQSANTFTGLGAGTYTGYVKDAAGCISSKNNIVISATAPVTVTTFVRAATSCSNDGQIQVFRAGGVPPYSYSLDGTTFQASNVFNGLSAGAYTATVKDSKGCVGTQPAVVTQGAAISVNLGKTNTSSCANDGTIQANAAGGVGPYTYSIDGTTFQSSNSFGSLGAGTYTVTVKDTKGCLGTANTTITVNQIIITASVVNATACASANGSVQLFRTGGTGPYSYSINGNTYQSSSLFTGLSAGNYTGYVKDSKGCVAMLTGIVVGPQGCNPLIASSPLGRNSVELVNTVGTIRIQAYPNPSVKDFTLALEGFNSKESVAVTVTDLLGRIVYQVTGTAKLQYKFGGNFIPGMYNVQVVQGNEIKILKLIKQ